MYTLKKITSYTLYWTGTNLEQYKECVYLSTTIIENVTITM